MILPNLNIVIKSRVEGARGMEGKGRVWDREGGSDGGRRKGKGGREKIRVARTSNKFLNS